jgi:hypothetical protein
MTDLCANVGGGVVSAAVGTLVESASYQLAASRFLYDKATHSGEVADFARASALANDSRQNLLAAHELCAKEARERRAARPFDPRDAAAVLAAARKS